VQLENQRTLFQLRHQITDIEALSSMHVVTLYKALGWGKEAVCDVTDKVRNKGGGIYGDITGLNGMETFIGKGFQGSSVLDLLCGAVDR